MTKDCLNFALVGCGRIVQKHCQSIAHLKSTRLVAVCDVSVERAREVGEQQKVPWYTDYHEMMAKHPEVDVVSVLTPSGDHARHVIELTRYKRHILVEKPMALTVSDAEEMIRACDQAGVRLFVVKQNRTNPPIVKLKEAVQGGRFGKMVAATVRVRWCRTQEYYAQDAWRGTWSKDGGVLMNQASHHVDLLTWLMGDVESVFMYTATRLVTVETEDTAVAVLRFHNGALGVIEATTAARPVDLEGSVSVLGERGAVEVGGFAVNQMKTWNFVDATEEESKGIFALNEAPPNVYGFGHSRYIADVVSCIRDGKFTAVEGIEGMKSLLLINALYESMETGREVPLLFRPRHVRLGRSREAGAPQVPR
jgi:UDP-N-acetyl-2-amino-2-deoxyglucuronate dehydrogenase